MSFLKDMAAVRQTNQPLNRDKKKTETQGLKSPM